MKEEVKENKMTIAGWSQKWDNETDVLIIGAGGAGLSAAIEACDVGANVLILEKTSDIGGATAMSGGHARALTARL